MKKQTLIFLSGILVFAIASPVVISQVISGKNELVAKTKPQPATLASNALPVDAYVISGSTVDDKIQCITRDRWKQGISSRLELADAELALTSAKSNYLQSVYDYLNASVELDKALGLTARK